MSGRAQASILANGSGTSGEDARAHLGETPPFCNDDIVDLFLFGVNRETTCFRATMHQNAIGVVPKEVNQNMILNKHVVAYWISIKRAVTGWFFLAERNVLFRISTHRWWSWLQRGSWLGLWGGGAPQSQHRGGRGLLGMRFLQSGGVKKLEIKGDVSKLGTSSTTWKWLILEENQLL